MVNFKPFAGPEEPRSVTAQDFAAEQLELRLEELEAGARARSDLHPVA